MKKTFIIFFASLIFIDCNNTPSNKIIPADTIIDTVIKHTDTSVTNDNIITDSAVSGSNSVLIGGESVGKILLGMDASNLENILGKPDMSDAAMGKAWLTWNGKPDEHNNKTELNIYTAYKDNSMRQQTVQEIRTTSSFFTTADSIHVYSALDEIKNKYVVKKVAQYNHDTRAISIYDDKAKGIAFEIASANTQNICIGIIVHSKNKNVNDIYLTLHPDMKRFDK